MANSPSLHLSGEQFANLASPPHRAALPLGSNAGRFFTQGTVRDELGISTQREKGDRATAKK